MTGKHDSLSFVRHQPMYPISYPQLPSIQRLQRHLLGNQILQYGLHERSIEPRQTAVNRIFPVKLEEILTCVRVEPPPYEEVRRPPANGGHKRLVYHRPQLLGGVEPEEEYPLRARALRRPEEEARDQPREVAVAQAFHQRALVRRAVLDGVVILLDPRHPLGQPALYLGGQRDQRQEQHEVVGYHKHHLLLLVAVVRADEVRLILIIGERLARGGNYLIAGPAASVTGLNELRGLTLP